jgi:hypothetical protein
LRPTLTEAELQQFEQTHQVKLPEDYRMFLREIGNGEGRAIYGLDPLERAAQYRDLSKPFPFVEATDSCSDEELNQWGDNQFGGILEFCSCGCAIYCYIVVNGPRIRHDMGRPRRLLSHGKGLLVCGIVVGLNGRCESLLTSPSWLN